MSGPLVSIIIPCYNAEATIAEAIESALGQTYAHKEVIVIDDGSPDRSLDFIKSFGNRIRWETGSNRGACAARNRGVALARGEFVQFLDADDVLHDNKLAVQLPIAARMLPGIVFCKWESTMTTGASGHLHCSNLSHEDPVVMALERIISTPAPLYPTERIRELGGWREDLTSAQDFEFNLRLACNDIRFIEISDRLLTVRRRQSSVSSDMQRVLGNMQQTCQRAYQFLGQRNTLSEIRKAAFAARLARLGRAFLIHGDTQAAMKSFQLAREMHPSGGIPEAYSRSTRILRRLFGPVRTERIVQFKRRLGMPRGSL